MSDNLGDTIIPSDLSLLFTCELYFSIGLLVAFITTESFILTISRSSQCSTTGVTKAVVCGILYVGWCI